MPIVSAPKTVRAVSRTVSSKCSQQRRANFVANSLSQRSSSSVHAATAELSAPTTASPSSSLSPIESWNGKRLQTQVLQVAENTLSIRSLDWDRDRFDIEFGADASAAATPALTPAQTLAQLRAQLDSIKASVDAKKPDTPLTDLRSSAQDVQRQADQLASSLSPQSASLQARLDVLGPAPARGAPAESVELASQRKQLTRAKNDLDNQITQAHSLSTESTQLAAHVSELNRDQFQAQLTSRTATPFSAAFWADPVKAFPDDRARIAQLGSDIGTALKQVWQPPNRVPLILCLVASLLMMTVVRWLIERTLVQVTTNRMPAGHLRRSALAVTIALAYTFTVGLAAHFVYLALNWNDILDADLNTLARKLVRLVTFAAFMTGLGRAMLSNKRPSWRLTSLSDDAAQRLHLFPWLLGGAAFLLGLQENINSAIGISLSASVTTRGIVSVLIGLLIADSLIRLGKSRRATVAAGAEPGQRPVWVGLVVAAAFICVALIVLGVATGYIAFAFFIARQMLWVGVILTGLFLLMHLVDDIFDTVFAPKGRTGKRLQASFGLQPNVLEQIGTILSGVTRAMLLILAVAIVLAPFGAGPQELTSRVGGMLSGGTFGTLHIVPTDIFDALLVFGLGMVILRVVKEWLSDKLLPKTSLDLGMQNSMMTLLGYVGGVMVFVLALVALKVNLQGIAWMASALSVGIGFGLQAIVQNFISGLILLAERPVKVGDWVSIGGVEGDIRRINVRATEIQMSDRSTMIVPNSQFITQNVRNVTLANAQGRVHIVLPMPLDTDAIMARELILDVLNKHPGTLAIPEPYVRLDNLDGGTMTFDCIAYVEARGDLRPVSCHNVPELVSHYGNWSAAMSKVAVSVAVLYSSDYGYSDRLSQSLARGVTKAGVATEMLDVLTADPQEVVAIVGRSKGLILMCPPSDSADARVTLAALTTAIQAGTKILVAESYGGRDEPVDTLIAGLLDVKAEVAGDALRVRDTPHQAVYQMFEEAGTDLAQVLTQKEVIAKKKAAMAPEVSKALARLSSGLYVVTAAQNDVRSAMVASWVSQASFEPLGLTIAVAKDRAIESLLQVGDHLVLNCLGESNFNPIMKHFLQRFQPGADRFEGVAWAPAAHSGVPVLQDSIAYMECRVVSRMETPDHWITYAEVVEGKVLQPATRTAVHRRKVASYY
ncbi:MAG: hypothetical protein WDW36_009263 [Sanguina aurantia]